ncbi:DUF4258 domain-containing protein [Brevibacillus brevis X23]|nr:DUF4258 domain-containing protein [Brevibacillus brevis X23]
MKIILSKHAEKRMNDRAIRKSNIQSIIQKGEIRTNSKGIHIGERNNRIAVFKVVDNDEVLVITVYYTKEMYKMAKVIAQEKKICIEKAFRFIMARQRSGMKGKAVLQRIAGDSFVSFDTRVF